MDDIWIALKKVICVVFATILGLFVAYFVLANNHIVFVNLNPLAVNNSLQDIAVYLWVLPIFGMILGFLFAISIVFLQQSKYEQQIKKLKEDNTKLLSKIDKLKAEVSKAVV